MKKVAKVFLYISLVINFIVALLDFAFGIFIFSNIDFLVSKIPESNESYIKMLGFVLIFVGVIVAFFFTFLDLMTIKKINTAKTKKEVFPWGILAMLFGSFIGGLITLFIPDAEFEEDEEDELDQENENSIDLDEDENEG